MVEFTKKKVSQMNHMFLGLCATFEILKLEWEFEKVKACPGGRTNSLIQVGPFNNVTHPTPSTSRQSPRISHQLRVSKNETCATVAVRDNFHDTQMIFFFLL